MSFNSWYMDSRVHKHGMTYVKDLWGLQRPEGGLQGKVSKATGLGRYMRFLGPAFLAYGAYSGYKEGGVWGAVKETANQTASAYVFGAAMKALGITSSEVAIGVGIAGVVGGTVAYMGGLRGRHLARPWTNEYVKKHANVEMATPIMDEFGMVATMRQRSIRAIQNSKLNGRTALGSEATYSFRPYQR